MTYYAVDPQTLQVDVTVALGSLAQSTTLALGEVTVRVSAEHYLAAMSVLQTHAACQFEQLIDLCGVDYSSYGDRPQEGPRFAVVLHLLSVTLNQRVRVVVFAIDDDYPVLPSVTTLWASANWYEREAFDLFGIVFEGHSDLRRILTDYGFVGHPFRKDFPVNGYVEMRYDEALGRVVYQPVTIELRENTPRIHRESGYGGAH
jgi:NADH-quinone oxidoreductase subunit C